MKARTVFFTALAFSFSGCATVPQVSRFDVHIADVVENVRCELRDAMWDLHGFEHINNLKDSSQNVEFKNLEARYSSWFKNQTATIVLTAKVVQTDAASADGAFGFSLLTAGLATLSLDGGHSTKASRTETFTFDETLSDQDWKAGLVSLVSTGRGRPTVTNNYSIRRSLKFTDKCDNYPSQWTGNGLLGGKLGIQDFLARIDRTVSTSGEQIVARDLVYTVDFVIASNSSVGPKFKMIPIGSDDFGGGFSLKSSREDTHTMKVSFSPLVKRKNLLPVEATSDLGRPLSPAAQRKSATGARPKTRRTRRIPEYGIPLENQRKNDELINRELLRDLTPELRQ
ncbi:hypothetical protein [Anderseniella sp. Alg231-50]|uniref:hypothetical protein n=1 Tax=Anderseniella sp. Alg231-50 TaxID=1922226 RepID=UPI00307B480F